MRNTFGNAITYTIFGESHGKYIGITIDGLSSGVRIREEYISRMLELRRPKGLISTTRVEEDEFEIISGVFNGYTTGAPLTILIKNKDIKSSSYEEIKNTPRPGHADYTSYIKYKGYSDYRGNQTLPRYRIKRVVYFNSFLWINTPFSKQRRRN